MSAFKTNNMKSKRFGFVKFIDDEGKWNFGLEFYFYPTAMISVSVFKYCFRFYLTLKK